VNATPGGGTRVPLYILGSSMYGAAVAAALGLPYAFASHFAPDALLEAVAAYRREFRPSAQLEAPHVIAGVNVIAADTGSAAREQLLTAQRLRASAMFGRGRMFTDEEADAILASPHGQHLRHMLTYAAVGTPAEVRGYLEDFVRHSGADELIVAHQSPGTEARLRSAELLADSVDHVLAG
jgi:luciferase family oxidoreductase group 1